MYPKKMALRGKTFRIFSRTALGRAWLMRRRLNRRERHQLDDLALDNLRASISQAKEHGIKASETLGHEQAFSDFMRGSYLKSSRKSLPRVIRREIVRNKKKLTHAQKAYLKELAAKVYKIDLLTIEDAFKTLKKLRAR